MILYRWSCFLACFQVRVMLTFAGAFIYALLPVDLLPEALFGIVGYVCVLLC